MCGAIESLEARVLLSAVSGATADVQVAESSTNTPPVARIPFFDVAVDENAADSIFDLSTVFSDAEDATLSYRIELNSNSGLVNATANGSALTLRFAPNQSGNAFIVVRATDSGGLYAESAFAVTVTSTNSPPTVENPLDNVTVNESADPTVIDLSAVFADAEDGSLDLSVQSVTNRELVNATLDGSTLTLNYGADQSGVALVTIRATDSGGLSVENTFLVTVNAVPTVVSPIEDVTVDENSDNTLIDLSGVFADVEDQQLTYSVYSNSNGELVNVTIEGNTLILDYAADSFGTADVTVRATDSDGAFVDAMFHVTVNEVSHRGRGYGLFDLRERRLERLQKLFSLLQDRGRAGEFWGFGWRLR